MGDRAYVRLTCRQEDAGLFEQIGFVEDCTEGELAVSMVDERLVVSHHSISKGHRSSQSDTASRARISAARGLIPATPRSSALYWFNVSSKNLPGSIVFVEHTQAAKQHIKDLFPEYEEVFQTAKPEALIQRILQIATDESDLVLDSFAGTGTTGTAAQKMGRRWIMVELGEHCETHILPRLKKVIDGTDEGGITETVDWKGGGGFRYFRLAPSLLEKDARGNWVISKDFDAAKLSEAVCKLMGFVYQPDETRYWMQGRSSEADFIYVTTQNLTHQQLAAISEEVGEERTLLVCCKAFRANADSFPNLTIRKIPQAVLRKCEWGHDDYSLNVQNLPEAPRQADAADEPTATPKTRKRSGASSALQEDLFSQEAGK